MRDFANFPNDLPMPGERIAKPQPMAEVWPEFVKARTWKPTETPGVEVNGLGNFRTNLPLPADKATIAASMRHFDGPSLERRGVINQGSEPRTVIGGAVFPEPKAPALDAGPDDADDPDDGMTGALKIGFDPGRPGGDETCFIADRRIGKSTLFEKALKPFHVQPLNPAMEAMLTYTEKLMAEAFGLPSAVAVANPDTLTAEQKARFDQLRNPVQSAAAIRGCDCDNCRELRRGRWAPPDWKPKVPGLQGAQNPERHQTGWAAEYAAAERRLRAMTRDEFVAEGRTVASSSAAQKAYCEEADRRGL